jgi:hypothetical protein
VQLSKIGTGIGSSATKASPPSSSDKAPLLNGDDDEFEGSGNQIEENSSSAYKFKVSKQDMDVQPYYHYIYEVPNFIVFYILYVQF